MTSSACDDPSRFQQYMRQVVRATLHAGMTASKVDSFQFLQPVDAWGFPKYPGRTVILPPTVDLLAALEAFILANSAHLHEADAWLGTWINPLTGEWYLDITTSRASLEEARRVATALGVQQGRQIVAIYNSLRKQTVYL